MGNSLGNQGGGAPAGPTGAARKTATGAFRDAYSSIEELQTDLRRAGLESSNLIVGIDMTKSNEWTGKLSNGGRNLHYIDPTRATLNPYERVIGILGKTLEVLDDDKLIPVYGFGCNRTHDRAVFSLNPGDRPCMGFQEALDRYRAVAPTVALAGPTSFAPIISRAAAIARATGGYHILLIICDGSLTRGSDLPLSTLSPQERDTIAALQEACQVPLSIIAVGVGDGEGFEQLRAFDDRLPAAMAGRSDTWDNFQFVPFNSTIDEGRRAALAAAARRGGAPEAMIVAATEAAFALNALMEVPDQYREVQTRGLLDRGRTAHARITAAAEVLDPPAAAAAAPYRAAAAVPSPYAPPAAVPVFLPAAAAPLPGQRRCVHCTFDNAPASDACAVCGQPLSGGGAVGKLAAGGGSTAPSAPAGWAAGSAAPKASNAFGPPAPPPSSAGRGSGPDATTLAAELARERESHSCPICLDRPKDTAFACGHQTCGGCAAALRACPVCRAPITTRIRLYG